MKLQELKQHIYEAFVAAYPESGEPASFEVTFAADAKFGDFATNIAMVNAKPLKQAPRAIAERLVEALQGLESVERVEVAGPGFINLTLKTQYWAKALEAIDDDFARSQLGKGQKVQVEYVSANPTGPTTIGNARGGFIGEVLARVLDRAGYEVVREYYFNNAGTQISKLLESVKMEAGLVPASDERQYRGQYIADLAKEYAGELKTKPDAELKELITRRILEQYIRPAMKAMGIEFDVWFNEADLLRDGRFDETVRLLRQRDLVFERDGATWIKTGALGDAREERVIIKSNGDPTYMAPDLAYHADIFGHRGFDYAIKVLGPDHVAQFPSVYAVVHELFPDKQFRMAGYQWMRVMRDGQEVKVSKRLGQFITVQELIEQVTQPVALFLTLMRSAESHMDFDLNLAVEQSARNPYYYVMYAYARAHSILRKAAERGLKPAGSYTDPSERELGLIKQMLRLPELVEDIAVNYTVHQLTFYGLEIARLFQEYYEQERILGLPEREAASKLLFVQRFVTFMDIYWSLLGIVPQDHMEREESAAA
jgi:arginyl-tRNA synthetase